MKSTDLLLEDHKNILGALDVLAEIAGRAERGQIVNQEDVESILDFLKGFGDQHHQGKEEHLLFPALLRDRAQKNYPELCALVFEHDRHRSLVEGLSESMVTKHTKDLVYYAKRLNEILRAHIKQEEEGLFPLVDSALSTAEDEIVALDMQAYDSVWQERELSTQLRKLADMKSKYLANSSSQPSSQPVARGQG